MSHFSDVIPFKIDAVIFGAFPIFGDGIVWLEDIAQVVDMEITDVLYTGIVDKEDEEDGAPYMVLQSRSGGNK